jgi:hypothetical protein
MRTTIEITSEQRARLMEMAARRGEEKKRRRALMLKGALAARDADRLRAATQQIRESWR